MRITNPIRHAILDKLDAHRRNERHKQLQADEAALALRCYRTVVSEEIEAKADALNEALPSMVKCDPNVYVGAINQQSGYLHMGHSRPAPNGRATIYLREEDPLFDDVVDLFNRKRAWNEENNKAYGAAKATLARFKTAEQLAAGWPEIMGIAKPVIDAFAEEQASKANVPAIVPAELNAMFALPVEEERLAA